MTREERTKLIRYLKYNRSIGADYLLTDKDIDEIIKALEQEPILDKIRAEIEQLPINGRINWDGCCPDIDYPVIEYVDVSKNKLLSIIDKYKTESEELNNDI